MNIHEATLLNPEKRQFLDAELIERQVEEIYHKLSEKLGQGKTAEVVYIPEHDSEICFKIIAEKRLEELYESVTDAPIFNDPKTEAFFLRKAQEVQSRVRVPEPICYWEGSSGSLGKFKILIQERLDAVTIQDILWNTEKLAPDFSFETFKADLENFIKKLNEDSRIHHRDLTVCNIMIERGTNRPCVIDFGDSEKEFGGETRTYSKDRLDLQEVLKTLEFHIKNQNN